MECLTKKTNGFTHSPFLQNIPSQMFDRILNMPLDYLGCFVVLREIPKKVDICQTDYSIHSKLSIFSQSKVLEVMEVQQANKRFSFIFFVTMFQTKVVINRSGACYFLHASNQWHLCQRVHLQSHASNAEGWHTRVDCAYSADCVSKCKKSCEDKQLVQ